MISKKDSKYLDPNIKKYFYPLLERGLSKDDLSKGIEVLKKGFITMNKETEKFEKEFSKVVKSKYSLMVNSGSSANLLAAFAACNPLRKNKFKLGDEALIPALCWSTSLWPLVQSGLVPKFIDVNPFGLRISYEANMLQFLHRCFFNEINDITAMVCSGLTDKGRHQNGIEISNFAAPILP